MRTVYRIVGADGAPLYWGDRAHVLAKLGTRRLRDQLDKLRIERGKFDPAVETEPPAWEYIGPATNFVA